MTVFFFTSEEHSEYFKELLTEHQIKYEFQFDEEEAKYYFGVNKSYDKTAKKLNYLVHAKFRKPFISSATGKFLLLGVTLLFITLAIAGYLLRPL